MYYIAAVKKINVAIFQLTCSLSFNKPWNLKIAITVYDFSDVNKVYPSNQECVRLKSCLKNLCSRRHPHKVVCYINQQGFRILYFFASLLCTGWILSLFNSIDVNDFSPNQLNYYGYMLNCSSVYAVDDLTFYDSYLIKNIVTKFAFHFITSNFTQTALRVMFSMTIRLLHHSLIKRI